MLFTFLKYLQPTHYFQLFTKTGTSVFPVVKCLPESILKQLKVDKTYRSIIAQEYDLSWQAVQKGYIGKASRYSTFEKITLQDNYHFIRKYFNPAWVFYVLILRVFSFHNPFNEINAWLKTRKISREPVEDYPILYHKWNSFASPLIKQNPKISIIIPTLNRYPYLKDVLNDLEKQDYSNFELIIVDQSTAFNTSFYANYTLDINLIHQKERALWLARNQAIKRASGEYVLLFDDDSRVNKSWVRNHIKAIDFFNADISSGVSISTIGAKVPTHYSFFRLSDQLDTGNVLIKKQVFKEAGLFDRQFEKQRMGDGEFGLRVYLSGYLNVSNPFAKRVHLKAGIGGLREMGSWDAFRPQKWFSPRPIPSVLYFFRTYFKRKATILALLRTVPLSIMPYRYKKNKVLTLIGVFVTLLLLPVVLFQVYQSWKLATKKIKQGALIDRYY